MRPTVRALYAISTPCQSISSKLKAVAQQRFELEPPPRPRRIAEKPWKPKLKLAWCFCCVKLCTSYVAITVHGTIAVRKNDETHNQAQLCKLWVNTRPLCTYIHLTPVCTYESYYSICHCYKVEKPKKRGQIMTQFRKASLNALYYFRKGKTFEFLNT